MTVLSWVNFYLKSLKFLFFAKNMCVLNVQKEPHPNKTRIAPFVHIYDSDQPGHPLNTMMTIAVDSLDIQGLKLFYVDSKGSGPIWRMPKLFIASILLNQLCDR